MNSCKTLESFEMKQLDSCECLSQTKDKKFYIVVLVSVDDQ